MAHERYILKKLDNLSESDKKIVEKIVKDLGEWASITDVARYLKINISTVYRLYWNGELLGRKIGNCNRIYSRSIILVMSKKKIYPDEESFNLKS